MNPTSIDWPNLTHTSNPVYGCPRMPPCDFCYARKLHAKRHRALLSGAKLPDRYAKPFAELQFFPKELDTWTPRQSPRTVFVGSMSDVQFWPYHWLRQVLDQCRQCPQHTFMFLTKGVLVYDDPSIWTENTMQGITVLSYNSDLLHKLIVRACRLAPRPYISYEPLFGACTREFPANVEWVIVGAQTAAGGKPDQSWIRHIERHPEIIQSIKDHVPAEKLWWKKSMRGFV